MSRLVARAETWERAYEAFQDINFAAFDYDTVRIYGKKGVHIKSDDEIRVDAAADVHIKSDANIRAQAGSTLYLQSGSDVNVKAGGSLNLQSGGTTNILAGGNIIETGSAIHLNGPSAGSAAAAGIKAANWTNRVPLHEPWVVS